MSKLTLIPFNKQLTTKKLNLWDIRLSEDGVMEYAGNPVSPTRIPVYVYTGVDKFARPVDIPAGALYRRGRSPDRWIRVSRYLREFIDSVGKTVEVLLLSEKAPYLHWLIYEGAPYPTVMPMPETTFDYDLVYGKAVICGYRGHVERLRIPAQVDGFPVERVIMPPRFYNDHLRELEVAEGVEEIAFYPSNACFLERIQIPESTRMLTSLWGIQTTGWYKRRPDGQVYLGNCYCGTKGKLEGEELSIREGTAWIPELADVGVPWKRIILPGSVRIIDEMAFSNNSDLEELHLQEGLRVIRGAFRNCRGLKQVYIPDGVESVTDSFGYCENLEEISVPAGCRVERCGGEHTKIMIREG